MTVSVSGQDITKYLESISWSGDENQLARKLIITCLHAPQDPNVHNLMLQKGDRILLTEGGLLFDGIILTEERAESGIKIKYMAYDYAWYLRSKVLGTWKGSPAAIAWMVCEENGIPCGSLYSPEGEAEIISTGEKSISQVIGEAYGGTDAHIYMQGTSLCTEKYGETLAGVVTGDDAVIDGTYKSSLENMVNQVVILGASDQPAGEVDNGLFRYGTIRETYKISGGKEDPVQEAEKLLKGIEDSGKIVVTGNPALQTGRAVIVEKVNTKIRGRFVIISDDHSVQDAEYRTTLGLRFEEVV